MNMFDNAINNAMSKVHELDKWREDEIKKADAWKDSETSKAKNLFKIPDKRNEGLALMEQINSEYIKKLDAINNAWKVKADNLKNTKFQESVNNEMSKFEELLDVVLESDFENIGEDEMMTEASMNPVKKFKKSLEKIKNKKPKEYSDNEEVKKFIDESYDTIDEVSDILEQEPAKLRKVDIANAFAFIASWISFCCFGEIAVITGGFIGIAILSGFGFVASLISIIIQYIRANDDRDSMNDLLKIKTSLQKVKNKNLPQSYKNKIEDLITKISDAEDEILARMKLQKESVSADDLKLEIFESCRSGEISEEERDNLLSLL